MKGIGAYDSENDHEGKWAPTEVFESILQYSVIPTFDLILEGLNGVLLVRRCISPYRDLWALPGLRMFKGETIEACLSRIAKDEVGLRIDPAGGTFVNQAVISFNSDQGRQDLSTCYAFQLHLEHIFLNPMHFTEWTFAKDMDSLPDDVGGLYRDHLDRYFKMRHGKLVSFRVRSGTEEAVHVYYFLPPQKGLGCLST